MVHRIYNQEQQEYIQRGEVPDQEGVGYDLAIIEFDDHGSFWKLDQLEDTVNLIERRNTESKRGVFVVPFVHGWKNNADPDQRIGDLVRFREELGRIASLFAEAGSGMPDGVIGVYLGWRGATSRVPIREQLTFWDRRVTAERIVSHCLRETLFRIMGATRARPESKCFLVGHSMGGLIVGKTLSPSLITLLLTHGRGGVRMPADFVLLLNPALDALASWQFIDFLKRSNARLELRSAGGQVTRATGPIIASITSEADRATGKAYPLGRTVSSVFATFRTDHVPPLPSQRYLATHAEGHVDFLVSHQAWMEDGEVVFDRVPGAYNDTPFWIIQVSGDICRDHGDTRNPMLARLIDEISRLNRLYDADVQAWMVTSP